MREASDTLLALVDNLLGFADLETGKLVLKQEAFALRAVLSAALQPLAQRAQHKGLTLVTQIAPEVVDTLLGDPERLCQILVSLINNAMKFTAQGSITVRVALTSQSADEVVLHWTVTDTGIGIPEGHQRLIFEAFRQGDGSSTRVYGGVGLGLTIAAHLVAMMGGDIWVRALGLAPGVRFISPHVLPSNLCQCYNLSKCQSRCQTWQTSLTLLPASHNKACNACGPLTG